MALLHTALSEGFDAALRIDRSFSDALIGAAKVYMELGKLAGTEELCHAATVPGRPGRYC